MDITRKIKKYLKRIIKDGKILTRK